MSSHSPSSPILHVAFYPWFAIGHFTPFLRLANKLAERGHQVSFILPTNAQPKLAPHNHFPHHLSFIPITLPPVDGLPPDAATTNDIPGPCMPLLMKSMDMTRDIIEAHLVRLKPNIVFYDLSYWMPDLAQKHGFKSVHYVVGYISNLAYISQHVKPKAEAEAEAGHQLQRPSLVSPPPGFPSSSTKFGLHGREAKFLDLSLNYVFKAGVPTLGERLARACKESDAIGFKSCKEMEGAYCEYVEKLFGKPVLLAGPTVPKSPNSILDERIDEWLKAFPTASVIYCAFGSEPVVQFDLFQHILLGLELTGRPFFAALRPPINHESLESAMPEGFTERIKGRGIVEGGWVQQQLILQHPSVGCFLTHSGPASLAEAMVSQCQVVLMPQAVDQFVFARMMSLELKIGVEVERREGDGFFTKEAVNKAISLVMDEESEVGREVRVHHAKWRDFILTEGLEDSYITGFIQSLHELLQR